jgi:hypothetical protein
MHGASSNECSLGGKRIVIKCARPNTNSVGVTYLMLKRLDEIVGAFELDDGSFEVWALTPSQYQQSMRATASKGPSAGRVGLVTKVVFEERGRSLGRVRPM